MRLGAPADPVLAVQRKEAAAKLGIGVDTFDRHVRPYIGVKYVGKVRLYPVSELERWLHAGPRRSEP